MPEQPVSATSTASTPLARALVAIIRAYQRLLSPLFGPSCRYLPTCSSYALDAVRLHGGLRGGWLALTRLLRCHPFGSKGYDPVPHQLEQRWWLGRSQRQPPLKHSDSNHTHNHQSHD